MEDYKRLLKLWRLIVLYASLNLVSSQSGLEQTFEDGKNHFEFSPEVVSNINDIATRFIMFDGVPNEKDIGDIFSRYFRNESLMILFEEQIAHNLTGIVVRYSRTSTDTVLVAFQEFVSPQRRISVTMSRIKHQFNHLHGYDDFLLHWTFQNRRNGYPQVAVNIKNLVTIFDITKPEWISFCAPKFQYREYMRWANDRANDSYRVLGFPVLDHLCTVDNCTQCVCVGPGERIRCLSSYGYVSMWIGAIRAPVIETFLQNVYTYVTDSVVFDDTLFLSNVTCAVAFSDITISEVSLIYVTVPPYSMYLNSSGAVEGSPITFTCVTGNGRPRPNLFMHLYGDIIRKTQQRDVYDAVKGMYTSVLTGEIIANRTWNGRVVNCTAQVLQSGDEYHYWNSSVATINYTYPPRATIQEAINNANVLLTCVVDGNPVGNITWINKVAQNVLMICTYTVKCQLHIQRPINGSLAVYECVATNNIGQDDEIATVFPLEDLKKGSHQKEFPWLYMLIGLLILVIVISVVGNSHRIRKRKQNAQINLHQTRENTHIAIPLPLVPNASEAKNELYTEIGHISRRSSNENQMYLNPIADMPIYIELL